MRLEWIEDILAVSELGSFNAAAEARLLTPSAFTRRIRMIEQTLGTELFERNKKPITLKPHVRDNLWELHEAATVLKRVRQVLSSPEADLNQRVTLICQHALTALVAPKLLNQAMMDSTPNVRVQSDSRSECFLGLIKREVDFALVYEKPGERPDIDIGYCDRIQLGSEVFIPVIKRDFSPEIAHGFLPSKLPMIGYPMSVFLGEVLRETLFKWPTDDLELICVAETGLSLAVVEFVRGGIGVGWTPQSIAQKDLQSGALINLEGLLPKFELDVTMLRIAGDVPALAAACWRHWKTRGYRTL